MRRRDSSDVPRAPWPEQRHTHTQRRAVSADLQPVRARTDGRALLRADATHLTVAGIEKSRRRWRREEGHVKQHQASSSVKKQARMVPVLPNCHQFGSTGTMLACSVYTASRGSHYRVIYVIDLCHDKYGEGRMDERWMLDVGWMMNEGLMMDGGWMMGQGKQEAATTRSRPEAGC